MGFSEMLVIAIIGLIVIGPQRIPEVVHMGFKYWRMISKTLQKFSKDLHQELGVEDIKQEIRNDDFLNSLEKKKRLLQSDTDTFEQDLEAELAKIDPIAQTPDVKNDEAVH